MSTTTSDRTQYIDASEIGAVLGLSPFATPADVYYRKLGMVAEDEPTAAMRSGVRLESAIVEYAGERLGRAVVSNDATKVIGRVGAKPDGWVSGTEEGIEAKKSSRPEDWGDEGTDQIPPYYLAQCVQQMAVWGFRKVWVPVLILAGFREEWRLYVVQRDDELCENIVREGNAWWDRHVAARVPPDDAPVPVEWLQKVSREPLSTVMLDDHALSVVEAWEEAKAREKAAEQDAKDARARALMLLGVEVAAECGVLPDGRRLTYKAQKSAPSFDATLFKAEHPELAERYMKQGSHRVLRVQKGK